MSLDARILCRVGTFSLEVEVAVAAGETVALLGPNGAGKSTVLRCLAGLVALGDGRIVVDDEVLDDPRAGVFVPAQRRPIGMVFQDHALFPSMSARENVAFGLRARGVRAGEARRVADRWLERVGLDGLAERRPTDLSGGQSQRVALARALAVSPRLVLLDEPMAALDVSVRSSVRSELRRHLAEVEAVRVLVTHDPVDAFTLADRVVVLDRGVVVQSGSLAEVAAHPRSRYVADLVGLNLVPGTVERGVLRHLSGTGFVVADAPDGPAFAVVRPSAIVVQRSAPVGSSARNVWRAVVGDVDRLGDRVRIGLVGAVTMTAEITASSFAGLELAPGDEVHASVKATEIEVYPA